MLTQMTERKEKRWVTSKNADPALVDEIVSSLHISRVLATLLVQRGSKTPSDALSFLRLENEILGDPFLMRDMEPAVERILRALRDGERITVYGDYDVDGVTSVCTLLLYLREAGADISYYIPNRIGEGYGVSVNAIRSLRESGTSLVITVDTGVTAVKEIEEARALGVDFVVTDHHECQNELPNAVAVVNPHRPDCAYPFCELAGVGVVFKLVCALEERLSGEGKLQSVLNVCDRFADLVAIGTIADVMPIVEENKLIVKLGLSMIEKTPRPGIAALIASISSKGESRDPGKKMRSPKITSGYIGYTLAPRINAAGRILTASRAVELFLATDSLAADALAEELCDANRARQEEENRIMQEAYRMIEEGHDFQNDPVIVLASDDWHHGVIGIVSSRITEKYGLPSILISFEGAAGVISSAEDIGKGSGRSVKGLNLASALLSVSGHLTKFGGHELAAGLSVKRGELASFREAINTYAREHMNDADLTPTVCADMTLYGEEMTIELVNDLRRMEPYGVGNPMPVFYAESLAVHELVPISGGRHTRLLVGDGTHFFTAMCFGVSTSSVDFYVGDRVDLLFTLDINEWAGRRTLQLIVKELRLSESYQCARQNDRERFASVMAGGEISADEDFIPNRSDFALVYSFLRRTAASGIESMTYRVLLSRLKGEQGNAPCYVKLRLILRIFDELHLIAVEEHGEDTCTFRICHGAPKTDLETSSLLQRLRTQRK